MRNASVILPGVTVLVTMPPTEVTIQQTPRDRVIRFVLRRVINLALIACFFPLLLVLIPMVGGSVPFVPDEIPALAGAVVAAVAITGW